MSVEFYERNADAFISQTVDVDMSAHYQAFLPLVPDGGSILDAGSGSGRDSLAFKRLGYDVHAFDASAEMAAATQRTAGVPTIQTTFQEFEAGRQFDGIWACASLLHVRGEDLPSVFSKLLAALGSEGVIYASFKYGHGEREKGGRSFTDLDEATLAELVSKVEGLAVRTTWVTSDVRPGRENELWLNCLLEKD